MSDAVGGVKGGVCLVACLIVSTGCRSHRRRGWALVRCRRQATGAERGHGGARSGGRHQGCAEQRAEQRAQLRSDLAVAMRSMHAKVTRSMHAQKAGGVREWIANWKRAIRHVRTALRASLGNGHGNNSQTTQAEHMRALRFRQYLAHGVRAEVTQAPALACVSLDAVCD